MKNTQRVWLTPAYVLHQYAYRDTSRIVEAFTRDFGRICLFARGARAPKSALRAGLRPFQRLLISWSGKSESGQITAVEIEGAVTELPPARLMSGFYVNELLMKLTERWDAHPHAFDAYAQLVSGLMSEPNEEPPLRRFEKRFLEILGYGLDFSSTDLGEPIKAQACYRVRPDGAICLCTSDMAGAVSGRSIIDLAREVFADPETLRDAKRILRSSIESLLDGRQLGSRDIMRDLHSRVHS